MDEESTSQFVTDPDRLQEIAEEFENAAEPTFKGSGGGDIEAEPGGEEDSGWTDIQETFVGDDGGRDSADGGNSGTGEDEGSENAGSEGLAGESGSPLDVQISGQPISVDVESFETYEGVMSEDFATYSEMVIERLDAVDAMMVVLMVAIFLCAGINAVDTLLRRFEKS